jgi:hypothetical protein
VTVALRPCDSCVHFDRETGGSCTAFPTAIPHDIIVWGADHDVPRGDEEVEGIVFELDPAYTEVFDIRENLLAARGLQD